MFRNEDEFRKVVGRLNVDDSPDRRHKALLRQRMVSAFEKNRCRQEPPMAHAGKRQIAGRRIMISSITKLAAAAAVIIIGVLVVHNFTPRRTESQKSTPSEQYAVDTALSDLVPLALHLPKPMFVGTPVNMRVSNLEKPRVGPRKAFLVPVGTHNVSLGKSVTSSDNEPIIGDLSMITDGDKEATDGSLVELAPFTQSITIDLGAKYEVYAILLWHYHKQARAYFDVVVQVADDPDFIVNVRTLFNNDHDNSSGPAVGKDLHYIETYEGKLVDAKGVQARYVRLYSNGNNSNDLNHYIEVEVFGRAAPKLMRLDTELPKPAYAGLGANDFNTRYRRKRVGSCPQICLPTQTCCGESRM